MKSFLVLLLGVLGFPSIGQAADLRTELREYARPLVHTTSRDVHVYHWTRQDNVVGTRSLQRLASPRDRRALDYINYLKELFWKPERSGGMAGNGVYVAIDPIATRGFGSVSSDFNTAKDWILIQTVMPAGVRYLNVDYTSPRFSPALLAQLNSAGCPAVVIEGIFSLDTEKNCRNIRNQLVWDLDLMGIRYGYSAADLNSLCKVDPKVGPLQSAMVLFDDRAINFPRILALTPEIPANDPHTELRLIIRELFEANMKSLPYFATSHKTMLPWSELEGMRPRTDVARWAQHTLMGCGGWSEDL